MALIARRTGQSRFGYDYEGYEAHKVYQYRILDRYKSREAWVGTEWASTARNAVAIYRLNRMGKTD